MSPRRFFSAMRRSLAPFDGRVGRRLRAGGAIASATSPASLRSAAVRLRSCDRCSDAVTVRTPSTRRPDRRCKARSRRVGERTGEPARSQDSSTRESVVLTDCPPGPLDRENRQRSSPSGITTDGSTCRSPGTVPASRTGRVRGRLTIGRARQSTGPAPSTDEGYGACGMSGAAHSRRHDRRTRQRDERRRAR